MKVLKRPERQFFDETIIDVENRQNCRENFQNQTTMQPRCSLV